MQALSGGRFRLSLLLLVVQQLIVASSTFFIAHLAATVANGRIDVAAALAFVMALVLVYIPASASQVLLEGAKIDALDSFTTRFRQSHFARGRGAPGEEHAQIQVFAAESSTVLRLTLDYGYDLVAVLLNTFLSVIALALVTSTDLLFAYVVSALFVLLVVRLRSGAILRSSEASQQQSMALQSELFAGWDSIIIGNAYNLSLWERRYHERVRGARRAAEKASLVQQTVSSGAMVAGLAPILGFLAFDAWRLSSDVGAMAVLVATLPRQVQTIQHLHVIVSHAAAYQDVTQRLLTLFASLEVPAQDFAKRVRAEAIDVHHEGTVRRFSSADSLVSYVAELPAARVTLRGQNGAGKSSILYLLRGTRSSLLIPASHSLVFHLTASGGLSTGQKTLAEVEEAAETDVSMLLLDEWDANLDDDNRARVSDLLDHIAKTKLVVEVRHGGRA
ncbi:hypothetical protein [Sorangium sp. So ce426]|uniref:hypothetical protein n=1 Tax=Sorangium sp. So ce426 TaxID=3133312 RepID=UPI003F5C2D06